MKNLRVDPNVNRKNDIIKNQSNILDIGSNDGTFLNFFAKKNKNYNFYGVDPSSKYGILVIVVRFVVSPRPKSLYVFLPTAETVPS